MGKSISERPRLVIIVWLILFGLGFSAAITGFGQGTLFSRMESSRSMVPGSESDLVMEAVNAAGEGEAITSIVTGVKAEDISSELGVLHDKLNAIESVRIVNDPLSVREKSQKELAQQKESAVQDAISHAQSQISQSTAAALAAQNEQLATLPPTRRSQAEQQIAAEIRKEIETQIRNKVSQEIDARFAQLPAPETALTSASGFAVVTEVEEDVSDDVHSRIDSAITEFETAITSSHPNVRVDSISHNIAKDLILNQVAKDLVRGETIGLPMALLFLVIVFGGVIAAGLPLSAALVSIGIASGLTWFVTFFTNVDSFILNILTIIGLALSIDYGLLVVSRYREEIGRRLQELGYPADGSRLPDDIRELINSSVTLIVKTAGRTVFFSALTIAVSIAGLLVMKAPMLKMIAMGGMIVTLLAVLTAVTFVPALIKVLGVRMLKPSVLTRFTFFDRLVKRFGDATTESGIFSRLAEWVHRHPWPVLVSVASLLVVSTLPLQDFEMRSNFTDYVPAHTSAKYALDEINSTYPALRAPTGTVLADTDEAGVKQLRSDIAAIAGVDNVSPAQKLNDHQTLITFHVDTGDQVGHEATQVVKTVRELNTDFDFKVGGSAALQYDFNRSIMAGAPYAALVIVVAVLLLLFLMTGSVVAALKALIINSLSLIAGLGLTVLVFHYGLFGLPKTAGLETFVVACAVAFGFGLAMDYEVFLLARIKEYWDSIHDNDLAVERGLQRSGRIITAAAVIIIAVFVGFIFGELLPIRQIGVALAIIVLVDATLVRMLLVPAFMTLMGRWNWWAPRFLRSFYEKFKITH
ncbi:RND superfamily putative drug exporter [Arcanobacterium pluranimalium]|uniref:MMPL family transporter n=1 Tax=Arcanobacterium pluranimalium TaxID=108028 RepID=UPI00195D46BB|nr:MMPL family transporter [Arcanobacterium pluranimalium]MBM7825451.1 RND superfamily putative drug exporter [Arcanobacterium pluranimalium]